MTLILKGSTLNINLKYSRVVSNRKCFIYNFNKEILLSIILTDEEQLRGADAVNQHFILYICGSNMMLSKKINLHCKYNN